MVRECCWLRWWVSWCSGWFSFVCILVLCGCILGVNCCLWVVSLVRVMSGCMMWYWIGYRWLVVRVRVCCVWCEILMVCFVLNLCCIVMSVMNVVLIGVWLMIVVIVFMCLFDGILLVVVVFCW